MPPLVFIAPIAQAVLAFIFKISAFVTIFPGTGTEGRYEQLHFVEQETEGSMKRGYFKNGQQAKAPEKWKANPSTAPG